MSSEESSAGSENGSTLWLGYWPSSVKQRDVKVIFNREEAAYIENIAIRRAGSRFYCFVNFNSSFTARNALDRLGKSTRVAGAKVTVSVRGEYDDDDFERSTSTKGDSCSQGSSPVQAAKRKDKKSTTTSSSGGGRPPSWHDGSDENGVELNSDIDDDTFNGEDQAGPFDEEYGASLFLGGIAREAAEDNVRRALKSLESDITAITVKRNKSESTSFAYVHFSSYSSGRKGAQLIKKDSRLRASTVRIYKHKDQDETERRLEKEASSKSSSEKGSKSLPHLWVGSLPAKTSENDIRKLFKKFAGDLDSIYLSQVHIRRRQRYAFVNFLTRKSAEEAHKFAEDAVVHDMKIISRLTVPRAFKLEETPSQSASLIASPAKPPAPESNSVNAPAKVKVKPTATVLPQTVEHKPAVVQTSNTVKSKSYKLTKKMSQRTYHFALECFMNEIRLLQSLHSCELQWTDGLASVISSKASSGEEMLSTVLNAVMEVEEKLSIEEWDYLMSENVVDNDSQMRMSRFTQLMVPWSTNPHIRVISDEGSRTLAFVGTCKATTVALDHVLAFRKTCLCLQKSKVAFLLLYCPILSGVLEEKFSVKLDGFQEGSSVLKLSGNNTSKVAEAKQHIQQELTDWHSISIRLHTRLSNSAIKRFELNKLSVVLVLDTKPASAAKDQLSPFILAGRPANHVRQAASLLQPIQRTISLLESTAEKMLQPGHAMSLAALEEELNVYLHLVSNAGSFHLTIISFLESDVEEAAQQLTAIDSSKSKCILQCSLSQLPLASHYLYHLLEKSHDANIQSVVHSIQEKYQVRITWDDSQKWYFLHGNEVNMQQAEQAIIQSPDLLGIAGALVLLPALDSGLILMLHRRFLGHVEDKMSVKCLALVANAKMISSGDLDSAVQPGTVVVGIFGPSAERVKQAQDWVSNLSPASRDLKLSPQHLATVQSGWTDGSLAVAQLEEQHGVLLQLQEDSQHVHAAGLTLKDVEAALQHISNFANTMTKITEQIILPIEQFKFIKAKFESDLSQLPCSTSFNAGATPNITLQGQQDAVLRSKAYVLQQLANFVAVHVTVRYPQLLHDLLEYQWESLCKSTAHHPGVICLRQEEPFSVSDPTPLTMFDCRSYLHFPPRVAAAVRCMSFLVGGVSKEQFAAVLQQLRSTSCGFLTQHLRLSSAQKAAVEKQLAAGNRVSMAAIHVAEDNTLHLFSLSPTDLQHAHQQVLSWVESLANAEIVVVSNHNIKQFVGEELYGAAASVSREFQVTAEVKTNDGPMYALLSGNEEQVQLAKTELQKRWKRIEETVYTKYVYVQHWLVPILEQQASKEQITELERRHGVACSLHSNAMQSYIESSKVPISDGKIISSSSTMNPTPFSWPVFGKEASSVDHAIEDIRLLLDVSLDERELCVPGVSMESVITALSKVARLHLVQVSIRSDNAGYRSQEAAWSGLFNASLDVTVRGIAPRPLAALHHLQADLDL